MTLNVGVVQGRADLLSVKDNIKDIINRIDNLLKKENNI
jgi:hypothetical protein